MSLLQRRGMAMGGGSIVPITVFATNGSNLNGTSMNFTLGDVLDIGTGDATFNIWFKTSGNGGSNQMMIAKADGTFPDWQGWIAGSDGALHFDFGINGSNNYSGFATTTTGFDDGAWHLVSFDTNRSGGEPLIYVDGASEAVSGGTLTGSVTTGDNSSSGALTFGRRVSAGSPLWFKGGLEFGMIAQESMTLTDHQNMYNSGIALCEAELLSLHSSTHAKLDGFWNFANWSGSTGTEIEDRIGANDATNTGTTPFTETGLSVKCS